MGKPSANVFDFGKHEEKVDKWIAESFTTSFMSDTKWRKVFTVLDDVDNERICDRDMQVVWKFAGSGFRGAGSKSLAHILSKILER